MLLVASYTFTLCIYSTNVTSDTGHVQDNNRKDSVKYEYPTTVIQPNQPTATYESIPLHEKDVFEKAPETTSNKNSVYSEISRPVNGDPSLQHNPAYSETTIQN